MNTYLDTLSSSDRRSVYTSNSTYRFRFGDGAVYTSSHTVHIPVHIGTISATLSVQVVECNVPLLISRESLKKAGAHLDFQHDSLVMFGQTVPIVITESGHYCISLSRSIITPDSSENRVLFSTPLNCYDEHSKKKIQKLHKQFAHPSAERLKKLLKDSGCTNDQILKLVDEISLSCDICKKYKSTPPRPAVSFPLASVFNETVAMDLKQIQGKLILHMIDHATRYSAAVVIPNKRRETIVKGILENWVRIFGAPTKFLTDNGGEFVNQDFLDVAEKFNVTVLTTAAESPWSNGLCEKHNGILADHVEKTMAGARCSLEMAVHWSVSAKNSLMNVYGFSPNQLVFGTNPNLPTVHSDRPSAQPSYTSEYITKNLVALHAARHSFIQQESCERLRRALNKKTRNISFFLNGQLVYYKRNGETTWHGPAKVLGRDSQNYLLKHGGIYVRVHPCRMQPYTDGLESDVLDLSPTRIDKQSTKPQDISPEDSDSEDTPDMPQMPVPPPDDPQPVEGQPEANNEPIVVQGNKDLPKPTQTILFRKRDDDEWTHGEVISRGGKASTASWHYMNIRDIESEQINCISMKGLEWVSDKDNAVEDVLFSEEDMRRFDSAKLQELQKWEEMDVYESVKDEGQKPCISCRWVCTEKEKGGQMTLKARLVARGFEENNPQIKTDSPTCQKGSLRLLLVILASSNWNLHSIDIKSAYLQGIPINRTLYVKPPSEAQCNTQLWRLKKCPYGLADAGRHWYIRVLKELKSCGGVQLKLDQAVFVWHSKDKSLVGIMVIHVDDFLFGGNEEFHESVISKFKEVFTIGLEETQAMKYLGISIAQKPDGIHMDTNRYLKSLKEIDTTGLGDKSRTLSSTEITSLKKLAGQINWITSQTRMDMAFDNCMLANSINKATVQTIFQANKYVRKAIGQTISLRYSSQLDISSTRIVAFTDASFANLPDRGSQGAYILFLCDKHGEYCIITWQSRRIRRVVNSTIAAECLAAVEASEAAIHLKSVLQAIIKKDLPISLLCDNRSLVDAVHSSTNVENKRLQIDVGVLRDMLQQGDLQEFRWIENQKQVANALTKTGASTDYLLDIIRLQLKFDERSGTFLKQ